MKTTLILIVCLSLNLAGNSQEPKTIYLTINKTVHLIFPNDVYYFDVGSPLILVDQKNAILKLAPKKDSFDETNLTVVTIDNVWYTFLLNYRNDIKELTYFVKTSEGKRVDGALIKTDQNNKQSEVDSISNKSSSNEMDYIRCCKEILQKAPSFLNMAAYNKKVYLALNNLFIHNDKLYFAISLGNTSAIPYDINFLQLTVSNKTSLKRSTIQEESKKPIFIYNKIEQVPANTKELFMVLVYDKFTIQEDQKLVFEMYEKKGGRNVTFDIKKDLIGNAIAIK